MDGHNALFWSPEPARLQSTGRRREAREAVMRLIAAAVAGRRGSVLVVFDGVDLPDHPGARAATRARVRVIYAAGPGGADTRIVVEAERALERGEEVLVVTDDGPLRRSLPAATRKLGVAEFLTPRPAPRADGAEKPVVRDADIEEHFLRGEHGAGDPGVGPGGRVRPGDLPSKPAPRRRERSGR